MNENIKAFLKKDSSVGVLLMGATLLAMIFANTPLHTLYDFFPRRPLRFVWDVTYISPNPFCSGSTMA